ncbi:MAG: permease-like cell division protein FtsX [Oscillospiraceae bacterium]|nr:permease-like cell division protein FtsX [Oscillospiraceae bacterium]
MKVKYGRTNPGYFLAEGIKGIFNHGFMSFAAIVIVVACLIILGSFSLLLLNINSMVDSLESQSEIIAYVDEDMSDADAKSLSSQLNLISNVNSTSFVTREEAMANFIAQYPDQSIFDGLQPDTFRHRYVIVLDDVTLMAETVANIEAVEGVADVNALTELAQGFSTVRSIISIVTYAIGIILIVISIFIISNTVKLSTFSRREEITIMKTVGATNHFIRLPFVYQGVILGIFGAAIAFFVQWGVYEFVCRAISQADAAGIVNLIPFSSVMVIMAVIFAIVGFLVGILGSALTIRKFLKV